MRKRGKGRKVGADRRSHSGWRALGGTRERPAVGLSRHLLDCPRTCPQFGHSALCAKAGETPSGPGTTLRNPEAVPHEGCSGWSVASSRFLRGIWERRGITGQPFECVAMCIAFYMFSDVYLYSLPGRNDYSHFTDDETVFQDNARPEY